MSKRVRFRTLLLAGAAALGLAGLAAADWLVTKDGAWVETKGPWKVDGRRIVFTSPTGTLSALRADDVDLDASAALTAQKEEEARRAAEPKVVEKRTPVLVLTEKELPATAVEEEDEGATGAQAAAGGSPLEVASWEKVQNPTSDTLEIFGTIRNVGRVNVTSPSMLVMIYGEDGGLLASNEGTINAGVIAPGATANFRVAFPGVPDFSAVKFDVQGRGFRVQPGAEEPGEEGAEPAPEELEQPNPDQSST
jgi:hypothetical protein